MKQGISTGGIMLRVRELMLTVALVLLIVSISGVPALADPPPGDICSSAIAVTWGSAWVITFTDSLALCANDYDPGIPGPSCTGLAAPGRDMVFAVEAGCGLAVDAFYEPIGFDGSIYAVSDCSDVSGSCVVGADAQGVGGAEELLLFTYINQNYYIIVDAHDAESGDSFTVSFYRINWDDPHGACCFPDGHCEMIHVNYCGAAGGVSHGFCSLCDPNPCVPTPVMERSWGAIKAEYRNALD
jgi:hypothetical protein